MRIALLGYGKMGKMIEEVCHQRNHLVVLRIDEHNKEDFNTSTAADVDVAIEFTAPDSAYANVINCIDLGVPVVSGSTGWNNRLDEAKTYCTQKKGSFIHSSNYSIGVNIFFQVNQLLAKLMSAHPEYSVSLKEIHHTQKKDAPSGTAVTLAEQVMANISTKKSWVNQEAITPDQLTIISQRQDPAPGTHFVEYTSPIDTIEIIHTAHSRQGFALGAVIAAEFLYKNKGVFTINDVLHL